MHDTQDSSLILAQHLGFPYKPDGRCDWPQPEDVLTGKTALETWMTLTPAQLHPLVESDRRSGWYLPPPVCSMFEHLIWFSHECSKEMLHYTYLNVSLIWNFTFNLNWSIAYFFCSWEDKLKNKTKQKSYLENLGWLRLYQRGFSCQCSDAQHNHWQQPKSVDSLSWPEQRCQASATAFLGGCSDIIQNKLHDAVLLVRAGWPFLICMITELKRITWQK